MSQFTLYAGLSRLKERLPLWVRLMRWVLWIGITVLVLGLGVFAYHGTLIRYLADDYCFSAVLKDQGFFQGQVFWYLTTSSRITVMLAVGVAELFGAEASRWLPFFVLTLGTTSLFFTLRALEGFLPLRLEREYSLLAALLVVFFAVYLAPNRLQSLYWRAGTLTYTFPIALGLVGAALGIYYLRWSQVNGKSEWGPLWVGVIAFFAGACSETYAAVQTGFYIIAGLGSLFLLRGKLPSTSLTLVGAALLGSLLAMVVMVLSPANHSRMAIMPPTPTIPRLVEMSVVFAWDYLRDSMTGQVVANLALLALSFGWGCAVTAYLDSRNPEAAQRIALTWEKTLVGLAAIPLVCYLLVACGMAPSAFGESAPPEQRALMISRGVLVAGTAAWGAYLGSACYWITEKWREKIFHSEASRIALIFLLALLWLYPLRAAWQAVDELAPQSAWTAAWDARDLMIRTTAAQGASEIVVPALDSRSGVMELGDANLWVNRCAASYYGMRSIQAEE